MQIFSYLSKIASSGSLLSWDGNKIVPFKNIFIDDTSLSINKNLNISGSVIVENDLKSSGNVSAASITLPNGLPYIVGGKNIEIVDRKSGGIEIDSKINSPVVWKWNEKDTSQFNINLDTISSGSLSVKNTSWGPSLCVDFAKISSDNGVFIFSISDFNLQPDELNRYKYILKFRLCNFSGVANDWNGFGITFLSNNKKNENYFGLANVCSFSSQNVKACKFENGNIKISENSPSGPKITLNSNFGRPTTNFEHEINYIKNDNSIGFQNSWNVKNGITTVNDALGLDETYYCSEFGNFNSSWFSQELSSCGFIILGGNGKNSGHFNIDNIEIIKHPINW